MIRCIRKSAWIFICTIWILQAGCTGALASDRTRLPNRVTIDGLDVSGMTVGAACDLLDAHHAEQISSTVFTLSLPTAQVDLNATELGVVANTRPVVEKAAALRRNDPDRDLFVHWRIPDAMQESVAAKIAREYSIAPADAFVTTNFSARQPFVFTAPVHGVCVSAHQVKHALQQATSAKQSCAVAVAYDAVPAAVSLADVQADRQLIATYTTSYAAYPYNKSNRVFNIKKAAACVNGVVLLPGETFDCNAILGDRTKQNGWRTATGIRDGAYVTEYGGGVCQVSSTLFNAVMMADLTITERHPHSWPMGYVDIGRDATISTGGKNLKFTNSTTGKLYFSAWTDDGTDTVTISIYGTPSANGQTISISSELVSRLPEEGMEIQLDESLPAGTRVIMRDARAGCVSRTYKTYYSADGTELKRLLAYEDTYRTIKGLTYVSPDIYYS